MTSYAFLAEVIQVELKRPNNTLSRVVRGTLILSLSTATGSLAAPTGLSNDSNDSDSSLSINTVTVSGFNTSINNFSFSNASSSDVSVNTVSVNNASFDNASFSDVSVNNDSINNVSFGYSAASSSDISFNNGQRSEVDSISAGMSPPSSSHTAFLEATTATVAIWTHKVHESASEELQSQSDIASRQVASSGVMASNTHAQHDFNANKDDTRSTGTRNHPSPNYVAGHQPEVHEGTTTTDSGGFPAGWEERYTQEGRPLVAPLLPFHDSLTHSS